jgi:hypothetical protein|tara:strand:- start:362 stop:595 length:234 start_codon:yes stop_codon:yes gene_type:complete
MRFLGCQAGNHPDRRRTQRADLSGNETLLRNAAMPNFKNKKTSIRRTAGSARRETAAARTWPCRTTYRSNEFRAVTE